MFQRQGNVFVNLCNQIRRYATNEKLWQEVRIPVPWGHIAGKWWGPTDRRPVLCFHGWQDNCGTFDRLIPLLNKNIPFLAVDFPGHGYSSHLPSGVYYHQTIYYITVHYLKSYFNWKHVFLMGHSLGGVISYTYSMLKPQNVDFIMCLDGSKPMVPKQTGVDLHRLIVQFSKYEKQERSKREPPSYTLEEIKERISIPHNGSVDIKYSEYLAIRNIRPSIKHPGKFYFARDPRLKVEIFENWRQSDLVKNASNMTLPMLIIKALSGSYYEPKENFYEVMDVIKNVNQDFHLFKLAGTHHMHLNNPEELSENINSFLDKYYKEDKSKGGLREEILFDDRDQLKMNVLAKI